MTWADRFWFDNNGVPHEREGEVMTMTEHPAPVRVSDVDARLLLSVFKKFLALGSDDYESPFVWPEREVRPDGSVFRRLVLDGSLYDITPDEFDAVCRFMDAR